MLGKNKTRPHFVAASTWSELQKLAHQEQSALGFVFSSLKVRITDRGLWRTRIDEFRLDKGKISTTLKKKSLQRKEKVYPFLQQITQVIEKP